jgi:hypothetical protein
MRGKLGRIVSPGAEVTFYYPGIKSVLLNGKAVPAPASGDGWVKVALPKGTYKLELKTGN